MFFRHNLFGIAWALFIFLLASVPGDEFPSVLFWFNLPFDKVVHVFLYLVLVFLLCVGFTKQNTLPFLHFRPILSALVISAIYGMIIEVSQTAFMLNRSFEVYDVLANFIGSAFGSAVFTIIYYKI